MPATKKPAVQFTPGPWKMDEPDNWHGTAARVFHVAESGAYEPIAQVQYSGWLKKQARANANLIAAAPDMYAALEMFASLDLANDDVGEWHELRAAWEAARAALEKAK
jgi:hypothetical protein